MYLINFIFSLSLITQAHEASLHSVEPLDDLESVIGFDFNARACKKASAAQIATVNSGNKKETQFLQQCAQATGKSPWCSQLIRPNPDSLSIFRCTYGDKQPHRFIHPNEGTWKYAFEAVNLIEDLEAENIKVCQIYNWWRPEPYNGNVGGAAGRHPNGTSVDVRFCNKPEQEKAFKRLCAFRKAGRLRALGWYAGTGLHLGVGDSMANTWGKNCP